MKTNPSLILVVIILSMYGEKAMAQEASYRPGLAFREDWKEIPAATPVTQEHVSHPELILGLYGPAKDSIKKSHHDKPADDPYYIWSGVATGNWAVTLKMRDRLLNLSSYGRIMWRSKQYGFRELHIILKLADGTWLVSRESDDYSGDWRIKEFIVDDLEWYTLDIESITELKPVSHPDLSHISEVGFTDLMQGGQSNACSRLDWIEVYAYLVDKN